MGTQRGKDKKASEQAEAEAQEQGKTSTTEEEGTTRAKRADVTPLTTPEEGSEKYVSNTDGLVILYGEDGTQFVFSDEGTPLSESDAAYLTKQKQAGGQQYITKQKKGGS